MKRICLPALIENLEKMLEFIRRGAEEIGFDRSLINKIGLACEEALVNIIKYAYPNGEGDIEIGYECSDNNSGIVITIIDSGKEFDPLAKAEPKLDIPVEERPIGGLGIFMIISIMDKVIYKRENGQNILTLVMYLSEK